MNQKKGLIDRLFLRLSYTFKIKLALFFGFSPCVVILVLAYFLQFKPISDIGYQQAGASFLIDSTRTLTMIMHAYEQDTMNEVEINEIDVALENLRKDEQQWSNLYQFESLSAKGNLISMFWREIIHKNGGMPAIDAIKGSVEAYASIARSTGVLSRLVLSQDIGTGFLVTTLCDGLPEALHYIAQNLGSDKPIDKHFTVLNEVLLANLNTAIETNEIYRRAPGYERSQDAIKVYRMAVSKLKVEHTNADTLQAINATLNLITSLSEQLKIALYDQAITLGWFHFWTINWIIFGGGLVFVIYFMRITRRPLEYLKEASLKMANGNLSIRVPITTKDEVADMTRAFNDVAQFFESILYETVKIVHQLTHSAGNIIESAQQMDRNINSLESSLRDISAFSEKFTHGMHQFEGDLKRFTNTAGLADSFANTTTRNLHDMEAVMNQMIQASGSIVVTLSNLQKEVDKINNLISSIVNIADQSNLLSINTAVRANKSGSEGRGFVIIADRIREMADKIAFAALDIEKVVNEIVTAVQKNVAEVNKFSDQINLKVGETRQISDQLNQLIKETHMQLNSFGVIQEGVALQTNEFANINASLSRLHSGAELTSYSARRLLTDIEFLYDSCKGLGELTKKFEFTKPVDESLSSPEAIARAD